MQTALLLSGAVIQGESMSVSLSLDSAEPADSPAPGSRSASSVFASMAAKGYQSVVNLKNRATVFDRERSLAAALKSAIIKVGKAIKSAGVAVGAGVVKGGAAIAAFSEKHQLKDKAELTGSSVADSVKKGARKVKERVRSEPLVEAEAAEE